MDSIVFTAVLFAAACHAGWNAAIKTGLDPLTSTVLITTGAGLVSLALLPFAGLPPAIAWPWVVASVVIHLFYFIGLSEAYRTGDLGQVYPLARGTAPLMTAGVTTLLLGERIGLSGWSGIAILAAGVLLLSLRGGRLLEPPDRRAVLFALFTALTICLYSVVDGIGARTAGNPHAYTQCAGDDRVFPDPPQSVRNPADAEDMAGRPCRRQSAASVLRHRDLGDDAGTDRAGGRVARNQRVVRSLDCGAAAERVAAAGAHHRGADDRLRVGADPDELAPETAAPLSCPYRFASSSGFAPIR